VICCPNLGVQNRSAQLKHEYATLVLVVVGGFLLLGRNMCVCLRRTIGLLWVRCSTHVNKKCASMQCTYDNDISTEGWQVRLVGSFPVLHIVAVRLRDTKPRCSWCMSAETPDVSGA
jgi:hypothetical protein